MHKEGYRVCWQYSQHRVCVSNRANLHGFRSEFISKSHLILVRILFRRSGTVSAGGRGSKRRFLRRCHYQGSTYKDSQHTISMATLETVERVRLREIGDGDGDRSHPDAAPFITLRSSINYSQNR